jgi:hypothetical protein
MVRHAATAWLAALSLLFEAAAKAQPANTATQPIPDVVTRSNDVSTITCGGLGLVGALVSVGRRGPNRIKLEFDGGGEDCGEVDYVSPEGVSAENADTRVEIRGGSCPAFDAAAHKLKPSRQRARRLRGSSQMPVSVRAGPLTITDPAGYFELENAKGRAAAVRWVRQTLGAARPCWDVSDNDGARRLLRRLYEEIEVKG